MVPRQRTTDQSNSRNIADSSNESNEGYFARLKRLFSFINPLSYLGGGSSSTSSGQQSQHGMWEYSEFFYSVLLCPIVSFILLGLHFGISYFYLGTSVSPRISINC